MGYSLGDNSKAKETRRRIRSLDFCCLSLFFYKNVTELPWEFMTFLGQCIKVKMHTERPGLGHRRTLLSLPQEAKVPFSRNLVQD